MRVAGVALATCLLQRSPLLMPSAPSSAFAPPRRISPTARLGRLGPSRVDRGGSSHARLPEDDVAGNSRGGVAVPEPDLAADSLGQAAIDAKKKRAEGRGWGPASRIMGIATAQLHVTKVRCFRTHARFASMDSVVAILV